MTKTFLVCTLTLLLIAGATAPGHAWNDFGHMAVAYIAYQKLTPQTKDRVDALLKLNPNYNQWLSTIPTGTSEADKKIMVFMIAATWPDQIKKNSQYSDDGTDHGDRPNGASSSQNTGYTDLLRHKYWHFVDTPFTKDGTALPMLPQPNAKTQIAVFRSILASSSVDALKSYDLVWLLHLVGDVHQPLHCATRVGSGQPNGDAGGNLVKICNPSCNGELHAFWDDVLGTSNTPARIIKFAKKLPPPDATRASKSDEDVWIDESFQAAQQSVYVNPIGVGTGPFTTNSRYKAAALALAKERVALAGTRLANLLNSELK